VTAPDLPGVGPAVDPNYQIQQAATGDWLLVAWGVDGDVHRGTYSTALDAAAALVHLLDPGDGER